MILIRLGELIFNGTESPTGINGGGDQMIQVNKLIGGKRVTDSLGRDDADIQFKGLFRGILSIARVKYLDSLRINGNQVSFSYSAFSYNVIVKSFKWTMRMAYQIDYELVLSVVNDLSFPITIAIPISFSDAIQAAFTEALDLAELIGEGGVIGAMGVLGLSLEAVENLNNATTAEISAISGSIAGAIASVDSAINGLGG